MVKLYKNRSEKITVGIKIKLARNMVINSMAIENVTLNRQQLDEMRSATDNRLIEGETEIKTSLDKITIIVRGIGEPNTSGTFNLTVDDINVFKKDQDLLVLNTARFDFFKTNVKLP